MDKSQAEQFWKKVDHISGGVEPILRHFLEANGFRNFSSFLHTSFDENLSNRMVQHVKSMKPDNRYYKILTDWYDEPLEGFELLEGWKSSLRTVFISMNSCDPSLFMATAKEVSPQQLQTQIQQQINKTNCIESITKRMKESEADPKFLPDLIEKFQTKLFAKLKEFDSGLPWNDKKQIPISFVCNFESGKKFEVKCPYCSSALVVYWRYQQATSNADVFYPKFNDSNYFKHMMRHWNGNLNTTTGNTRSAQKRKADDSLESSLQDTFSNSEEFILHSNIKIEDPEW
ncbi:unnamed protein product [Chironomus riparius]|uniref:Uncharacterized protein n=1 Tax=Chironomus riparius TaxID=315576 RepID=A0A9N9S834_9DIPT|nr:unnamed protein product [Chironomus riparius]